MNACPALPCLNALMARASSTMIFCGIVVTWQSASTPPASFKLPASLCSMAVLCLLR